MSKTYRIRSISWLRSTQTKYHAETPVGRFDVWKCRKHWFWCKNGEGVFCGERYDTSAAAKLAAQQWYEQRIAGALELVE